MSALLQMDAAILSDDQREQKNFFTGQDLSGDRAIVFHGKVVKLTSDAKRSYV
jgi:hypothetical protein